MAECYSCDVIAGKKSGIQAKEYVVELEGDWVLNHYAGKGGYLGYLILQTKQHRAEFFELTSSETNTLGFNIQRINQCLRHYWSSKYPDDTVERVYIAYLNETPYIRYHSGLITGEAILEESHVHFHLLTRTREMLRKLNSENLAWDLLKNLDRFPDYLRSSDNDKISLMEYLARAIGK
jgi:hypothetical protein